MTRVVQAFVAAVLSCCCAGGSAWQSGPEGPAGPAEARRSWGWWPDSPSGVNEHEHALLLTLAMKRAGIPDKLNPYVTSPSTINVYVASKPEIPGVGSRVLPAPLSNARDGNVADAIVTRSYTTAGFSGLPDHDYTLGDWAAGGEICPPGTTILGTEDAQRCHSFPLLGVINTQHFVPQAERAYRRHHALAVQRARDCKALNDGFIRAQLFFHYSDVLRDMVLECEQEALILEAVGQHFLQDSFAIGHMWQRWGYPTFSQYPGTDAADRAYRTAAASLLAGLIHGSEAVTNAQDLMSAGGSERVRFDTGFLLPGQLPPMGIGDIHAVELLGSANYATQFQFMMSCSQAGLQEVYDNTAMQNGPRVHTTQESRQSLDNCFKQRATNEAVLAGLIGGCRPGYSPPLYDPIAVGACTTLPVTAFAGLTLAQAAKRAGWPMPDAATKKILDARMSREIVNIITHGKIVVAADPNGTELANTALVPQAAPGVAGTTGFLGIPGNGYPGFDALPPYAEPDLPWPRSADRQPTSWIPDVWIARLFHKAHVKDWCTDPEAAPAALKASYAKASTDDQKSAACSICSTFVSRHVRMDGIPSVCDAAGAERSPIDAPRYNVPIRSSTLESVGKRYCSCYIYDVAKDFSRTASEAIGPLEVWSYGWWGYDSSNVGFHPYRRSQRFGSIDAWNDPGNETQGAPDVAHNSTSLTVNSVAVDWRTTPVTSVTFDPDEVHLHPGQGTVKSGIRFRVPVTGSYIIEATFTGRDHGHDIGKPPVTPGTTTDVHIYWNGRALFNATLRGFDSKAIFERRLVPGLNENDIIDFVVGNFDGDFTSDSTALSARLELSPLDAPIATSQK